MVLYQFFIRKHTRQHTHFMLRGVILQGDSKTGSFDPTKDKTHTGSGGQTDGQDPGIWRVIKNTI